MKMNPEDRSVTIRTMVLGGQMDPRTSLYGQLSPVPEGLAISLEGENEHVATDRVLAARFAEHDPDKMFVTVRWANMSPDYNETFFSSNIIVWDEGTNADESPSAQYIQRIELRVLNASDTLVYNKAFNIGYTADVYNMSFPIDNGPFPPGQYTWDATLVVRKDVTLHGFSRDFRLSGTFTA